MPILIVKFKTKYMRNLLITMALFATIVSAKAQKTMSIQEISDRLQIRELVDRYAIESNKDNRDYYRNIFAQNIQLRFYTDGKIDAKYNNVEDMITSYKESRKTKMTFHQIGQQVVDFIDKTHAKGTIYLTTLLVYDKNEIVELFIRCEEKYEKIDGRWWITHRDQHLLFRRQL